MELHDERCRKRGEYKGKQHNFLFNRNDTLCGALFPISAGYIVKSLGGDNSLSLWVSH